MENIAETPPGTLPVWLTVYFAGSNTPYLTTTYNLARFAVFANIYRPLQTGAGGFFIFMDKFSKNIYKPPKKS
ncbi:MAG: hypothetical protein IKA65_10960 [Lentisphaeria bacterium]|nr:hypothetical protein [Lentisphaeria bacterium]